MYLRTRSILLVPQLLTLLLVCQAGIFIRLSNTVVDATSGVPETTLSRCDSSATGDWILQVLTKEDGGRRYESARWRPPPRISGYETDGQQHWRTHIARRPSKMSCSSVDR